MKRLFVPVAAALLMNALLLPAAAAERPEDRWNLADLFPSVEAWNSDAGKLAADIKAFPGDCRGHLGDSAQKFKQCLERQAELAKRYSRLSVYANELYAEDTGQALGLELRQKTQVLGSQLSEATSFVSPEVLKLGAQKVDALLAQDKSLAIYRHTLDRILRAAPHTLDEQGEQIVATFGLATSAASSAYSILSNAEVPWPTVTLLRRQGSEDRPGGLHALSRGA